jgi:hypothetical protein
VTLRGSGGRLGLAVAVGRNLPLKAWCPDAEGLTGTYSRLGHHILTRIEVLVVLRGRQ